MGRSVKVVAGLLAVLLLARVGFGLVDHRSDREQILDELQKSIEASKEGRPGSVIEMISDKLTFNGKDASENIGQVADFIKSHDPEVKVENLDPIVTGDAAQIVSPVDLTVSFLTASRTMHFKEVTLMFHREPAVRFMVFPTTQWKLTDVQMPDTPAPDLLQ